MEKYGQWLHTNTQKPAFICQIYTAPISSCPLFVSRNLSYFFQYQAWLLYTGTVTVYDGVNLQCKCHHGNNFWFSICMPLHKDSSTVNDSVKVTLSETVILQKQFIICLSLNQLLQISLDFSSQWQFVKMSQWPSILCQVNVIESVTKLVISYVTVTVNMT